MRVCARIFRDKETLCPLMIFKCETSGVKNLIPLLVQVEQILKYKLFWSSPSQMKFFNLEKLTLIVAKQRFQVKLSLPLELN